jgi:hypothetical protein
MRTFIAISVYVVSLIAGFCTVSVKPYRGNSMKKMTKKFKDLKEFNKFCDESMLCVCGNLMTGLHMMGCRSLRKIENALKEKQKGETSQHREGGDTISQDSIKAMKKAEAIQFGRIIPIDHDRKG